jgi:hypothetical protein
MSYLKIIGEEPKYRVSVQPFKSQHGHNAVRFIGEEVPETDKGFKYYSEDGDVISDMSSYTHLYRPNEYTTEEDEIESPEPSDKAEYRADPIEARLNTMSQKIRDLTPYVETKTAYIDDTEIIFDEAREGSVLVSAIDSNGDSVDSLYKREDGKIIVSFLKPIELVTTVTISIQ